MMQAPQTQTDEMSITRIFDAPRELVWKAWTEPERLKQWWGPKGYTAPVIQVDLRVGGKYLFCMRSPEGQDIWATGVYREIKPVERLVYTDSFGDKDGNVVPASAYGITDYFPKEMVVTVLLEDLNGKTKVTTTMQWMPEGEIRVGALQGWGESFDKLEESLKR